MAEPVFIAAEDKLRGDDAVAALLVLDDGRYVMQLRDAIPRIFYPGHWGCFGGAVEAGEDPEHALRRELAEEIEFSAGAMTEFTRFDFDLRGLGQKKVYRIFYEVPITQAALSKLVLHEGAAYQVFSGSQILQEKHVTPYDAFAILLHYRRERFQP